MTGPHFVARITQVARWEDDYFEMFAEPQNLVKEDARLVSLGMIVGHDPSFALSMAVGELRKRE